MANGQKEALAAGRPRRLPEGQGVGMDVPILCVGVPIDFDVPVCADPVRDGNAPGFRRTRGCWEGRAPMVKLRRHQGVQFTGDTPGLTGLQKGDAESRVLRRPRPCCTLVAQDGHHARPTDGAEARTTPLHAPRKEAAVGALDQGDGTRAYGEAPALAEGLRPGKGQRFQLQRNDR